MNENKTGINSYPGHMAKTKRELKEIIGIIDLIIEVVDSRIPNSSRLKEVKDIIKNKPYVLVLTKKDLCDLDETEKWVKYYEKQGEETILVSLKDKRDTKIIKNLLNKKADELNEKRKAKGLRPKEIRIAIIGIPNSGKSTLINIISNKKLANTGNTPGFTKNISWYNAGKYMLLDSPGILWPKLNSEEEAYNLASMSAIKLENLPVIDVANYVLSMLDKYYKNILLDRYDIDKLDEDYSKNYEIIGKKYNLIAKNNEIDYKRVALFILNDIKLGTVRGITFDRR